MMAAVTKLSDAERQRIVRLIGEGKSRNEIAGIVGRSYGTITNVARSVGHTFGAANLKHAHQARSSYSAERRAEIASTATQRAAELLEKFEGRYKVFNFGGKENTFAEHELDAPPVEAMRQMSAAFRDLMRTVLDIDRHDNRQEDGLAAVDEWLRDIVGSAS